MTDPSQEVARQGPRGHAAQAQAAVDAVSAPSARVVIIGPTPPPYHGVAVWTRMLRAQLAAVTGGRFEPVRLDTSDRRDQSNLGRWDATNVRLGVKHVVELTVRLPLVRPEIVYVQISQNVPAFLRDALFIVIGRLSGARVVAHLKGGYFRELYKSRGRIFRHIVDSALRRCSAVIVLAEEFRPIFSGLVASDRIHVVENGWHDPGAWELREHRPPPEPDGGTVLFLSTLDRTKGLLDLIRAVSVLRGRRPRIRLRVAGRWRDATTRAEALALIESEALSGSVELVGAVDGEDKTAFLASGDILALPTRYPNEGQPIVLIEAMAAGLPILSTRHASIASTAPDGEVGRLVDKHAPPHELAAVLDEMLSDPQQLARYGAAGRERFLSRYTVEHSLTSLAEVFERVLAE